MVITVVIIIIIIGNNSIKIATRFRTALTPYRQLGRVDKWQEGILSLSWGRSLREPYWKFELALSQWKDLAQSSTKLFLHLVRPECPPWTIACLFQSPFRLRCSRRLPLQLRPPDSLFSWACCPCLSVGIKSENWHWSPWVSFTAMLHFPNRVRGNWAEHVLHRP